MLRQKMLMMCARMEHSETAQLPSEQKTPVAYYCDTAMSSSARTCRQWLLFSAKSAATQNTSSCPGTLHTNVHYRWQWPCGAVMSPQHTARTATSCLSADGGLWERQRPNKRCLPLILSISWRSSACRLCAPPPTPPAHNRTIPLLATPTKKLPDGCKSDAAAMVGKRVLLVCCSWAAAAAAAAVASDRAGAVDTASSD